jgi:hypothetical protein
MADSEPTGGALDDLAAMAKESANFALELARPTLEAIRADPTRGAPWAAGLLVLLRQRGAARGVLVAAVAAAWAGLDGVVLVEGVDPEYVRMAAVAVLALLPKMGGEKPAPRLGKAGTARDPRHAAHRRRLVSFYEKNAPEKVKDVDAILAKYLGHEDTLFAKLEAKYAKAPATRASPARKAASPARKAASPVKAASPARAAPASSSKAHQAKADARAAMEARLEARLARKK